MNMNMNMEKLTHIPFTKMHGAGNDFVVIDNRNSIITLEEIIQLAPSICYRKLGVGADGIILLETPSESDLDYTMIYRNADGSDAGMCGNGARCLALFAHQLGLGESFLFNVHDTIYKAEVIHKKQIRIDFPITISVGELQNIIDEPIYRIDAGTEHLVLPIAEKELENEETIYKRGKRLRYHNAFQPDGINVNFFCGSTPDSLKLQTYERGVENLTLACGTGAIASAVGWHHIQSGKDKKNSFAVHVKGGKLTVDFTYDPEKDIYRDITLSGPGQTVFTGEYHV